MHKYACFAAAAGATAMTRADHPQIAVDAEDDMLSRVADVRPRRHILILARP